MPQNRIYVSEMYMYRDGRPQIMCCMTARLVERRACYNEVTNSNPVLAIHKQQNICSLSWLIYSHLSHYLGILQENNE